MRQLYPFTAILSGIFVAQLIGTLQVYISNTTLYNNLLSIKGAGFLIVPNAHILPTLIEFKSAFTGGLFFSLTCGAGISVLSFLVSWTWCRILGRNRVAGLIIFILWALAVLYISEKSRDALIITYFLLIPLTVVLSVISTIPKQDTRSTIINSVCVILAATLLSLMWMSQFNNRVFIDFRDKLLLSNPAGIKLSNFYYKHTLYAAEVFKPVSGKQFKTCAIYSNEGNGYLPRVEKKMMEYGYYNTPTDKKPDVVVTLGNDTISLSYLGKTVLTKSTSAFLRKPGLSLREFSEKCDRYDFFRKTTYFSLILGLPAFLFIIMQSCFSFITGSLYKISFSSPAASLTCFLIGTILWAPVFLGSSIEVDKSNFKASLNSPDLKTRIQALKFAHAGRISISNEPAYLKMKKSPYPAERYWMVRALAFGKNRSDVKDLIGFLRDPNLNVACKAYYSLGARGDRTLIPLVKNRLENSRNWYEQWYAFNALRKLGWKPWMSN